MRHHRHRLAQVAQVAAAAAFFSFNPSAAVALPSASLAELSPALKAGDLVFIRIKGRPFAQVALDTNTWTNHVGVVLKASPDDPLVAESAVPWSRTTTLSKFVRRSEGGRLAVVRLATPLNAQQEAALATAVERRSGIIYDSGFNLHSKRQFCSRFVREVLQEATGTEVGSVETLSELLGRRPNANLSFWNVWYFGRIPWQRETVTPASMLQSPLVQPVFDGVAVRTRGEQAL